MNSAFSKQLSSKKIIWGTALFLLLIGAAFVLYRYYPTAQKFFPKCPLYESTGLYCFGCGNTRALYYLLHGDFAGVFRSNIFFLPTLLYMILLVCPLKFITRAKLLYLFLILVVVFSVLRNLPWYPFTLLAPSPLAM